MITTTIYVPTPITSAEQAEALPVGTVAAFAQHRTPSTTAIKLAGALPGWWLGDERVLPWEVRGWTALIPVEVEVEHLQESGGRRREKTLYVTPWEAAS